MTDPPLVRIVVIEGSERSLDSLKNLLARQIGWSVVCSAREVSSAIGAIRRDRPEVAIVGDAVPGRKRRISVEFAHSSSGSLAGQSPRSFTSFRIRFTRSRCRATLAEYAVDLQRLRVAFVAPLRKCHRLVNQAVDLVGDLAFVLAERFHPDVRQPSEMVAF